MKKKMMIVLLMVIVFVFSCKEEVAPPVIPEKPVIDNKSPKVEKMKLEYNYLEDGKYYTALYFLSVEKALYYSFYSGQENVRWDKREAINYPTNYVDWFSISNLIKDYFEEGGYKISAKDKKIIRKALSGEYDSFILLKNTDSTKTNSEDYYRFYFGISVEVEGKEPSDIKWLLLSKEDIEEIGKHYRDFNYY